MRVKLKNYSVSQREFMPNLVAELMSNGLVYPNPTSQWGSAPLIAPEPGPAEWRFTVDLRPVNRYTIRSQFSMPVLEHELPKLANSKNYAEFDFVHSYWQLALHKDSQQCMSFIMPDGV